MVDATTALIFSAVGAIGSVVSQQKSYKAQRKAKRVQSRMADLQAQRERQNQIREERIRRAQIEAGAEATGAGDTSSAIGSQGSLRTQLGANLSFINTTQQLGKQASGYLDQAAQSQASGSLFGTIGGVANQFVTPDTYTNLFRKQEETARNITNSSNPFKVPGQL